MLSISDPITSAAGAVDYYTNKALEAYYTEGKVGRWAMNVGKTTEARAALEAAKKADPKSTIADMALARLDVIQGSMDPARQHLAAVLAAQPQNTAARFLLGEIAEKTGDRTGAIAQYRAVVAIDHNSTMALNNLAYMLSKDDPDE